MNSLATAKFHQARQVLQNPPVLVIGQLAPQDGPPVRPWVTKRMPPVLAA